ncbi:hypothetical protein NJ7G_3482 [Natrinema sp. J7-2]|nr:hypothetical protein NJ7G_3482 [Natrinema sp. J7-2]
MTERPSARTRRHCSAETVSIVGYRPRERFADRLADPTPDCGR